MKKVLAFTIMILFISVSIIPSTGNIISFDDTTPPVTTHSLNPPEPDGENGYYVNDVEVTLNATDDDSGVDRIEYRIEGGSWEIIPGDNGTFIMDVDGNDALIEYRAFDNAGNEEDIKWLLMDMDQTVPYAEEISWEAWTEDEIWMVDLTASAVDATSGMDRVEFYIFGELQEIIEGGGPEYVFTIVWSDTYYHHTFYFHHYDRAGNLIIVEFDVEYVPPPPTPFFIGIICNPEFNEENVSFFAIIVFDVGWFRPIILKHVIISNDYEGYIGKFFICITFPNDWPFTWR